MIEEEPRGAMASIPEDWEFRESDTSYLTHDIHRYSGKFVPPIARRAIELLTSPGDLVVDPYVGSGTAALEAGLLGRRALGVDLNPLAVLISRVKVTPVPKGRLDALTSHLADVCAHLENESESLFAFRGLEFVRSAVEDDSRRTDEWFVKWFQPEILNDLLTLDHVLRAWPDPAAADVGRVAFSNILRRSSRAHSGYPNVMFDKNATVKRRPARAFMTSLGRISDRVGALENLMPHVPDISLGDARRLPVDDGVAAAVITHPPYIGSVPYAEYGALSLTWLGCDPKLLDRELTGGRRQTKDVVTRFERDYSEMLSEAARVLRPGGHLFVMVGSPTVRGDLIDLADMTQRLSASVGLGLAGRTTRVGVNRRANKMGAEHLLFFVRA